MSLSVFLLKAFGRNAQPVPGQPGRLHTGLCGLPRRVRSPPRVGSVVDFSSGLFLTALRKRLDPKKARHILSKSQRAAWLLATGPACRPVRGEAAARRGGAASLTPRRAGTTPGRTGHRSQVPLGSRRGQGPEQLDEPLTLGFMI